MLLTVSQGKEIKTGSLPSVSYRGTQIKEWALQAYRRSYDYLIARSNDRLVACNMLNETKETAYEEHYH